MVIVTSQAGPGSFPLCLNSLLHYQPFLGKFPLKPFALTSLSPRSPVWQNGRNSYTSPGDCDTQSLLCPSLPQALTWYWKSCSCVCSSALRCMAKEGLSFCCSCSLTFVQVPACGKTFAGYRHHCQRRDTKTMLFTSQDPERQAEEGGASNSQEFEDMPQKFHVLSPS